MSERYYGAMARSNVCLHSSHIDKIVDRTIYTKDGAKEEVDVSECQRTNVSHSETHVSLLSIPWHGQHM